MDVFPEGHVHAGGGTSGWRCRQRWHGRPKIPPGDGLPQSRRPETRPPDIRSGTKDGSEAARGAIGPPALRDHAELSMPFRKYGFVGLTDESVCPTCGAGASACQNFLPHLLRERLLNTSVNF